MDTLITITNGLAVAAFIAFLIMVALVRREGKDERSQFMGHKLFSFLFTFLFGGLALIIVVTGWRTLDYAQLRVCITTLMSLNILVGLGYWIYLSKRV